MKAIRSNLSSEKLPLCQNTLKLLIIMNSHDLATIKELLESFTYNLNLKVYFNFIIYYVLLINLFADLYIKYCVSKVAMQLSYLFLLGVIYFYFYFIFW